VKRAVIVIVAATGLFFFSSQFARAQTNPQPLQTPTPPVGAPQKQPVGEEVDSDEVLRVKTNLVSSPVLIIGRDGKYIPNLRQEDFHVFDEGVEQNIAYFAPVDKPFTVALLIDTSRSTLFDLEDIQDAVVSFIDKMRPNDQALIVSFGDEVRVVAEPTSDREVLRRAIRSTRPGGNTRVYDAVDFVINERMSRLTGRKAIILFTDGVDTASRDATYEDSLRDISKSEDQIYAIQFSTYAYMKGKSPGAGSAPPVGSGFNPADYLRADAYLHQVAEATGTPLYPAYNINDLGRAVASIVDELHNEYTLGYYPQNKGQPGEFRRVEVRVNQPRLIVRARTGYVVDQTGTVAQAPEPRTIPSEVPEFGSISVRGRSSGDTNPAGSRWVCKGSDIPGNFALVKEGFDSHCPKSDRPNDENNAWFIRKPEGSELICKGFFMSHGREMQGAPIPSGYAVVGETVAPVCSQSNDPKHPANAWSVRIPGAQTTVCKGFLIPRGYVVIGESTALACPERMVDKNAWVITPTPYIETRTIWVDRF
jgi:VWFA-related protein